MNQYAKLVISRIVFCKVLYIAPNTSHVFSEKLMTRDAQYSFILTLALEEVVRNITEPLAILRQQAQ